MKIKVNNNPTYTLELSQEEFLVLFEAIGDRTFDQWEEYKNRYKLTEKQIGNLISISSNVYNSMNNSIREQFKPDDDIFFMEDNWLAEQYKESYKD